MLGWDSSTDCVLSRLGFGPLGPLGPLVGSGLARHGSRGVGPGPGWSGVGAKAMGEPWAIKKGSGLGFGTKPKNGTRVPPHGLRFFVDL